MTDRKGQGLQVRMDSRRFDDHEVQAALDELSFIELRAAFGEPVTTTLYAQPKGHWSPGDARPALADEDPAVMQAIGRCAASRVRWGDRPAVLGSIHPTACGWCEFPLPELLKACDWATWISRYITIEVASWKGSEGSSYARQLKAGEYENPRWAGWWALPAKDRAYRIEQARP